MLSRERPCPACIPACLPSYSLFPPFIPFVGVNLSSGLTELSSRGIVMRRELLIIYCISLCTVLTLNSNSFYISNFTVKRFAGEDSRNSLKSLPWVFRTYPQCFISEERTQLKIFQYNQTEARDKLETHSNRTEIQRNSIQSGR